MKRKIIEILKENQEWNSSLNYTADELLELITTSQRQVLIVFADWFTAKDGNEAEVDAFLENNE